jgi:hypothetical protein
LLPLVYISKTIYGNGNLSTSRNRKPNARKPKGSNLKMSIHQRIIHFSSVTPVPKSNVHDMNLALATKNDICHFISFDIRITGNIIKISINFHESVCKSVVILQMNSTFTHQ